MVPARGATLIELADADRAARAAETIMRALPGWFGIESSIVSYVDDARELPTFVASVDGRDVGFATVTLRTPSAAEIVAMGVAPDSRRSGVGRALVDAAASHSRSAGAGLLQVKTLGPSHPSTHYAETRLFYEGLGFLPLEETTVFWGEANPCLILVKPLP